MSDRIAALSTAVEADPENATLRLMLAEDRGAEALDHYGRLLAQGALSGSEAVAVARLAVDHKRVDIARGAIEAARHGGEVEGIGELDRRLDELIRVPPPAPPVDPPRTFGSGGFDAFDDLDDLSDEPDPASHVLAQDVALTFSDVGGMDDVKKLLHRMIIMPFIRPELYAKYGRTAGGGVLLYGPPGCGKTLMARAVAGECGLPFINLGIDDIVSPMQGQAELNVSAAFELARDIAPCVVFIDEIDAVAFTRSRTHAEMAQRSVRKRLAGG